MWVTLWNHCPCWALGRSALRLEGRTQQSWAWGAQGLKADGYVGMGFRVLHGDLNPRPLLFWLLYCTLSPVRPLQVLNLCVFWEGSLKKGRGEGRVPARKLELFSAFFEFVPSPSLTVLSVPSLSCLSVCLSVSGEGRERGSHVPGPDLWPHLPPVS